MSLMSAVPASTHANAPLTAHRVPANVTPSPDVSNPNPDPKPKSKFKAKAKSISKLNSKHSYISPNEIDRLSTTFFNTNLKPPRRNRVPSPPSLRASLLPPPCAEIDERPRWRVRRLVLWRDRVPPLRLAVLDPRRRMHLKRFQGFVTPEDPEFFRGVKSVSGVLRAPAGPGGPMTVTPLNRSISTRGAEQQGITACPIPPGNPHASLMGIPRRVIAQISSTSTSTSTARATSVTLVSATPTRVNQPRAKTTILSRKLARARTLQHSLILQREEEKRWRYVMGMMVNDMQDFVKSSTCVLPGGKKIAWIRPINIPRVQEYLKLMKSIRESSKNIWTHLPTFQPRFSDPRAVPKPVPGLKEAKAKVKGLEEREERKRKRKEARRLAQTLVTRAPDSDPVGGTGVQPHADVRVAIKSRAVPVTVLNHPRPAAGLAPERSPASTSSLQSIEQRRSSPSEGRQSSESDRIVTPPLSHRHASPEWTKPHLSPHTPSGSISERSFRTTRAFGTPKLTSNDLGEHETMPDEIANHLAGMLRMLHGLGGAGARQTRSAQGRSGPPEIESTGEWTARSTRPLVLRGETSEPDLGPEEHVPELEVSVYSEDSEGTDDLDLDGFSEGDVGQSVAEVSYATGQLNMDDDTKAAFSGISTESFV